MLNLLWDLHQHYRIGQTAGDVSDVRRRQTDTDATLRDIERRLDALTLSTAAIWSLVSERLEIGEDELAERVREIDLQDGRLDGKVRVANAPCVSCGRAMSSRHVPCIYCGAANPARTGLA